MLCVYGRRKIFKELSGTLRPALSIVSANCIFLFKALMADSVPKLTCLEMLSLKKNKYPDPPVVHIHWGMCLKADGICKANTNIHWILVY